MVTDNFIYSCFNSRFEDGNGFSVRFGKCNDYWVVIRNFIYLYCKSHQCAWSFRLVFTIDNIGNAFCFSASRIDS